MWVSYPRELAWLFENFLVLSTLDASLSQEAMKSERKRQGDRKKYAICVLKMLIVFRSMQYENLITSAYFKFF